MTGWRLGFRGRDGRRTLRAFRAAGLHNIYLVPSIRRGGTRGYEAARQALGRFSQG